MRPDNESRTDVVGLKVLVCDPGLNSGLAFLSDKKLVQTVLLKGKGNSWEEKTCHIASLLFQYAWIFRPEKIFIEFPVAHFRGNIKSVIKLSFLIGRMVEVLDGEKILIPVSTWRGSLPKEIGWRRAEKFFKVRGLKDDVGDACALAMYLIKNSLI